MHIQCVHMYIHDIHIYIYVSIYTGCCPEWGLFVAHWLYFRQCFFNFATPGSNTQNGLLSAVLSTFRLYFLSFLKIGPIQSNAFLMPPNFGEVGVPKVTIF